MMAAAARGLGLSEEAKAAFIAAAGPVRSLRAGARLAAHGDEAAGLYIVLSGVIKSCRLLETGQAQTLALFTPGEICGIQGAALGREPVTLAAVSASYIRLVPAAQLKTMIRDHPEMGEALWRAMGREVAILQEWMVGMGRRPALAQVAHLLCEVAMRMRLTGRVNGDVFDFPLTQTELADAVGLSPVHVNRVLQTLRADGVVGLTRSQLSIGDWKRLAATADFDPGYLRPDPGDHHASLLLSPRDQQRVGS
jgi:CRP-like cAMP-binding protein